MIAEVVRIFEDENVIHVSGHVEPVDDINVINLELILADRETIVKRLSNIERDVKRGDKEAVAESLVLEKVRQHLEAGELANTLPLEKEEIPYLYRMHLLSAKKILYVLNKKSGGRNLDELKDERWDALMDFMERTHSEYVIVDAGVEHELKDLEEGEKTEFRREYGSLDSGVDALIRGAYQRLGLMSFFTTGEDETRAWTVPIGATGPDAGAAIHTDFREKYIRAQVVSFEDLVTAGSLAAARSEGKVRTEGKEYIVKDGDIIEFMI
jgi:GTP-binding protein YchF